MTKRRLPGIPSEVDGNERLGYSRIEHYVMQGKRKGGLALSEGMGCTLTN